MVDPIKYDKRLIPDEENLQYISRSFPNNLSEIMHPTMFEDIMRLKQLEPIMPNLSVSEIYPTINPKNAIIKISEISVDFWRHDTMTLRLVHMTT